MSTLSVTTVTTGLSTTDLTLNTANTGAGDIVIQSDGLGIVLSGNSTSNTVDIAPNGHINISNNSVNTFIFTQTGNLNISDTVNAATYSVGTTFTANATLVNAVAMRATSNTFTLGTSTIAATGYMYLPNGLKINWGFASANNSTRGNTTFTSAFTTACYGVMTSGANSLGNTSYVVGVNTTVAQIRSSNATAGGGNVYYIAYGV
jgi:hypothetical protein